MIKRLLFNKAETEYLLYFVYNETAEASFKFLDTHKLIYESYPEFKASFKKSFGFTYRTPNVKTITKKAAIVVSQKSMWDGGLELLGTLAHEALHLAIRTRKKPVKLTGQGSYQSEENFVQYFESIYQTLLNLVIKEKLLLSMKV